MFQVSLTVVTHDRGSKVLLLRTRAATKLTRLLAQIKVPVKYAGDVRSEDAHLEGPAPLPSSSSSLLSSSSSSSKPAASKSPRPPSVESVRVTTLTAEVASLRNETESLREYSSRLVAQLGRREAKYALVREEQRALRRRHKGVVRELAEEKAARAQLEVETLVGKLQTSQP